MKRVMVSEALKLAADVLMGVLVLVAANIFLGEVVDFPVLVLVGILAISSTGLMVRQDIQIFSVRRSERA